MTASFDLTVTRAADEAAIAVEGELDLNTAPQLREQIVALVNEGATQVALDLSRVEFIDSSGLSVLIAGLKRLRERGGDLSLRAASAQARRVLEASGLAKVLPIG
jgi:anti-sigma B factor antagonist